MLREKHKTITVLSLVSVMLAALPAAGCNSETEIRETASDSALQQTSLPAEAITPAYEYVDTAKSLLHISENFAECTSSCTSSSDVVQISVRQTLQRFWGLWIWNDVDDASWSTTKNGSSVSVVNSKSGLPGGTYRLESVFTLTASSGKTETITIYSEESLIQASVSEAEPIETELNGAEPEGPKRIPEDRLAEWDFKKLVAETTSPEWDGKVEQMNRFLDGLGDKELKTAYQKAYALFMISYRNCDDLVNRALLTEYYGEDFYSDAPRAKTADGRSMHPSGYLYEGYENAFLDTFTRDRANAFLVRFGDIAARDGKELVYEEASNTRHCSPEYEILSRTENEIVIRETCYAVDSEDNRLDKILYINDNRFVKEDGAWKCTDFETKRSAAERIPEEKLSEWDLEKAVANAADPTGDEAVGRMNRFLDSLGDKELKKAYQKAYTLFTAGDWERKNLVNSELLTEYYGEYFYSEAPHVMTEDGYVLHPSGYLYEGYESAVFNTFARDRAEAFLRENRSIAARDGKELLYEAASSTRHCCPEYEVLSRTEDEIVIRETCYGTDAEGNRLDSILYVNDNRFVKEDGAWKCAAFETKNADF